MNHQQNAGHDFTQVVFRQYLSMVAHKCNLDLRFEDGVCPQTDGKVVLLPTEVRYAEKRQELTAYVLHEAGHARFTDMGLFKKLNRSQRDLVNGIEDVRIETQMCRIYAGAAEYFKTAYNTHLTEFKKTIKNGAKLNTFARFAIFCYLEAECYAYKAMYDVKEVLGYASKNLKEAFNGDAGDKLIGEVHEAIKVVPILKSTGEVVDLVKRLLKILEKYMPDVSQSQKARDAASQAGSDQKGNPSPQGGQDQPTQNQGSQSQGKPGKSKNGKNKSKVRAGGDKAQSAGQNLSSENSSSNCEKSFQEKMNEQAQANAESKLNPLDKGNGLKKADKPIRPHRQATSEYADPWCLEAHKQSVDIGRDLTREARRESSKLATALRSYIEANAETDTEYVSSGCKVKSSRLYRVKTGSTKVFTRTSEDPESSNTAVCILLDTSGSMGSGASCHWSRAQGDNCMIKATRATLSLYLALRNLTGTENVTTSVIAFPGNGLENTYRNPKRKSECMYLVEHGETLTQDIASRFGTFDGFGNTPIKEAISAGMLDLLSVPNVNRRVMFVITDGVFNPIPEVIDSARKQGIEIYGFSLEPTETDGMKESLGEHNVVDVSKDSLGQALFRMAKRIF